jgi:hypothetical protein
MADEWWKDFFSGLIVEFWRGALPEEVTRSEADFLQKYLRLSDGSRVLDVPCGAGRAVLPNLREAYEMRVGDIEFRTRNRYEPATATMESVYTISRGDLVENKRAVHRIYTCAEILKMLGDAGFRDLETYGSLGGEPFGPGSPTLVVVAEKNV